VPDSTLREVLRDQERVLTGSLAFAEEMARIHTGSNAAYWQGRASGFRLALAFLSIALKE